LAKLGKEAKFREMHVDREESFESSARQQVIYDCPQFSSLVFHEDAGNNLFLMDESIFGSSNR
jgi:hypothetical protein